VTFTHRIAVLAALSILSVECFLACSKSPSPTPPPPPIKPLPPGSVVVANVLTHHNDNGRTGANTTENCLTPEVATTLTQTTQFSIDGQIYAQPLVLTGKPNLLIVASTANEVRAFDISNLSTTTPVWEVGPATLGTPGDVVRGIRGPLGILSTPAIDPATGHLFVVARSCATSGTISPCPWTLHILDAANGKELDSAVIVTSFKDTNGVSHAFDPDVQWNRPGLLFQNGVVYVAWEVGQNQNQPEQDQPYHGFVMAFDVANLHTAPVTFPTTRDIYGGGIWQAGGGPAGDGTAVYVATGNSSRMTNPDSPSDLPATPTDQESSAVRLDFTPSAAQATGYYDNRPYQTNGTIFQYENYYDCDVASSGIALIPQSNDLVLGNKAGLVYLLDRTTMQEEQAPLDPFTTTPLPTGQTLHLQDHLTAVFGTPVVWSQGSDAFVYIWPFNDPLTSFQYSSQARSLGVLARSTDTSPQGAMLSFSANGTKAGSGVLWANLSTGTGSVGTSAEIRAYDPDTLSMAWSAPVAGYAKWVVPTVTGGRVYVASSTLDEGASVLVFTTPTCEK
jgi:hypothetical protein